jgi:transcriptional regulator with XRE-family HTH domain
MTTWLEKRLAKRSGSAGLETERLFLELTESFVRTMAAKNIRRAELARRMEVDRAVVTRVMAGDRNVTLRTLVSVATSLGCRLKIEIEEEPEQQETVEERQTPLRKRFAAANGPQRMVKARARH